MPGEEISAVERNVARTLSRLRRENGLTLKQLSEKVDLSESFLSRVENGKASITLASLNRLAEVFALPIGVFFEAVNPATRPVYLKRNQGKSVRLRGRNGINVNLLASEFVNRLMEPFLVDVNSAEPNMPMQSHEGQEFMHVQCGRCLFHYGSEVYELEAGDSMYFDSSVNHKVEPLEGERCWLLAVVTSEDFTFHKNMTRLLNE